MCYYIYIYNIYVYNNILTKIIVNNYNIVALSGEYTTLF